MAFEVTRFKFFHQIFVSIDMYSEKNAGPGRHQISRFLYKEQLTLVGFGFIILHKT